jgi:hypothetical protein
MIVARERASRRSGHRVVAHDGRADGIGANWVAARQQQARLLNGQFGQPRPLAAGDGFDAVNDRQVDWSNADRVDRVTRDTVGRPTG